MRRLRLGEEKRKEKRKKKKKKPQDENIMACPITYGGHKNTKIVAVILHLFATDKATACWDT